jgi:hypothetical protein
MSKNVSDIIRKKCIENPTWMDNKVHIELTNTSRYDFDIWDCYHEYDKIIYDARGECITWETHPLKDYNYHDTLWQSYWWHGISSDVYASKIRFITSDLYERDFSCPTFQHCWFEHVLIEKDIKDVKFTNNIKKHFIYLNNRISPHRLYFLSFLEKYNFFDKSHISFSTSDEFFTNLFKNGYNSNTPITRYDYDYQIETFFGDIISEQDITNTLENLVINKPYDLDREEMATSQQHNPWRMNQEIQPFFNDSFLFLCSESCVAHERLFLTEKVFKGFGMKKPMIVIGNPFTLKKLKEMGYKTFDKWFDESYDEIVDVKKRFEKISETLITIGNKSIDELKEILEDMKDTLEYNHNHYIERAKNVSELETQLIEFIEK